jgi:methionine-rich copper-binding protein CopC
MTVLAIVTTVSAHARYQSSIPDKGEVLSISPTTVEVTFSQDVQKLSGTYGIEVTNASGASVTAGETALDNADRAKMSVALQPSLANGRYEVHWKNVSDADGDPAEGAFSFYVGVQPTSQDLAADEELAKIGVEEEVTPTATGAPTASTPGTAPAPTSTPASSSGDDGGSNTGVIIIVVVAVAVGVVAGFAGYRFYRSMR